MLELRPNCELCDRDLPPDSGEARICSYECTFCADCVDGPLANVCPNCGGWLRGAPDPAQQRAPRGRQPCPPSSIDSARARALQRGGNTRLRRRYERYSSGKALMKHFTDHCVSATTRMASDLGFDVPLVSDATAAFGRDGFDGKYYSADEIHRVNLVSLDGEFCRVVSTAEITGNIG
jgi:hypothetical protein